MGLRTLFLAKLEKFPQKFVVCVHINIVQSLVLWRILNVGSCLEVLGIAYRKRMQLFKCLHLEHQEFMISWKIVITNTI